MSFENPIANDGSGERAEQELKKAKEQIEGEFEEARELCAAGNEDACEKMRKLNARRTRIAGE